MSSHEKLNNSLQMLLEKHNEWLLNHESGDSFYLQKHEIELEFESNKTLISFLQNSGYQTWRLVEYEIDDESISANLTRNFGTEESKIKLIPRAKAEELNQAIELARLKRANMIAGVLANSDKDLTLKRVELNKENGRFAQILIETKRGKEIAVLSDVSDSLTPEILIASAIFWLSKLQRRKKNPIDEIWILSEKKKAKNLQKLHACLKENWKSSIKIKEIKRERSKETKEITKGLSGLKRLSIANLWQYKPPKLRKIISPTLSDTSQEIIKQDPEKIDHLFSKNGETLRYLGLPFFRVRAALEEEKAWFGIEKQRRLLNEDSLEDLYELVEGLRKYRCFDSPNTHHAFYSSAPEAWLESILRKNIKQLDPNLILSPIYNQFRTSRDKIDLLALRKDGRLVIIELKVAADREMIFQAVDYWRKIELQRRKGKLNKANFFGEMEIADKPAIVYLVAPTLSYHPDFSIFAKTISNEIEIFRFDLAENWREHLKVLERKRIL